MSLHTPAGSVVGLSGFSLHIIEVMASAGANPLAHVNSHVVSRDRAAPGQASELPWITTASVSAIAPKSGHLISV